MSINKQVPPGPRTGIVSIPASKSRAHRLLIMAALSDHPSVLECNGLSNDILATINCLNSLGCCITVENDGLIRVKPFTHRTDDTPLPGTAQSDLFTRSHSETNTTFLRLPCRDSGSTLRFLLPLAGALGANVCFEMEGRLPERPLAPYDTELEAHGMRIRRERNLLYCEGRLMPGKYTLPGNISSQYISGLLMSLPLLDGDSTLNVTGDIESSDYIRMTEDALRLANISFSCDNESTGSGREYTIPGNQHYRIPETLTIESDWSGAAFFLCLGALSPAGVTVGGLNTASLQGDKAILEILERFGADITVTGDPAQITVKNSPLHGCEIDAAGIPDLIPVISVVAAAAEGTTHIINAGRLRLKESDRLKTTAEMLTGLGAEVEEGTDSLTIFGNNPVSCLKGGFIDPHNDHRIAMSAAVAASVCDSPVTVSDPECVKKSFADFWEVFDSLSQNMN